MESLPKDVLLEFHPETLVFMRAQFNIQDEKKLNEAIDILANWIQKQNHFKKKDFSREYLERMLILIVKGSVERAKIQIDRLCTIKTLIPDLFDVYNRYKEFPKLKGIFAHALLPKLTKNHNRIYALKVYTSKLNYELKLTSYIYGIAMCEYFKARDYSNGVIVICDLRGINIGELIEGHHLLLIRKFATIIKDGYLMRVVGIHIITESKMVDILIKLIKQYATPKLGNRIHVHKTINSLEDFVPKEILPKDCGGDEMSISDLSDKFIAAFGEKDNMDYFKEMCEACTDESKRLKETFEDQYLGTSGTFQYLSLD